MMKPESSAWKPEEPSTKLEKPIKKSSDSLKKRPPHDVKELTNEPLILHLIHPDE